MGVVESLRREELLLPCRERKARATVPARQLLVKVRHRLPNEKKKWRL